MKTLLAVVADTHAASRVGLCPPVFTIQTSEGGPMECHASPGQQVMWDAWTGFWQQMRQLARSRKAKLVAFHLGDGADDSNGKNAGMVSANKNDILAIAQAVEEPMVKAADLVYIARGTEYHVGEQCWIEEELAAKCGAVRSPENTASWWCIRLVIEGLRIHAAHHPPSRAFKPRNENGAASLSSADLLAWYAEMGQECPDIALFGHVHFPADSGAAKKPRVFYCPGWQMMTAFSARLGLAGIMRPIGGWWFLLEDGHYTVEPELHRWKKESVWTTNLP